MKILIIRNIPTFIDVKNNTYNIQEVGLAKALVRKGHNCDILFWTNGNEEEVAIPVDGNIDRKITVYYKKGICILKNTVYTKCESLFNHYDILQPCEYNQAEAWLLSKKYPQKTVIYHGPYYSKFNKRYNLMCDFFDLLFLRLYVKMNTPFIVKSQLAKKFLNNKGIQNVTVAGVGLDKEMLESAEKTSEVPICIKMRQNANETKFLYIGRIEERRNIRFIFEVLKKVLDKMPNSKLYMIGTGDKNYINSIWNYAKSLGVYNNIIWQERLEQRYLSSVYKQSDCFLLPTEYDIFGMVLLEAMYYENIVVTTSNGGSSTLMKNGFNGIIDDSKNAEMWAQNIISIMSDQDRMKIMKHHAAETIANSYTWDSLVHIFEKSYNNRLRQEAN